MNIKNFKKFAKKPCNFHYKGNSWLIVVNNWILWYYKHQTGFALGL